MGSTASYGGGSRGEAEAGIGLFAAALGFVENGLVDCWENDVVWV